MLHVFYWSEAKKHLTERPLIGSTFCAVQNRQDYAQRSSQKKVIQNPVHKLKLYFQLITCQEMCLLFNTHYVLQIAIRTHPLDQSFVHYILTE